MKSNPKTLAGVIVLVILAMALGFLLSRMIPTIGEVQREKSLTPTPLPEVPGSVMAVTRDPAEATPEPVLRTGSRGQEVKDLQSRLSQLVNGLDTDGMVGSETKAVLYSTQAKPAGFSE